MFSGIAVSLRKDLQVATGALADGQEVLQFTEAGLDAKKKYSHQNRTRNLAEVIKTLFPHLERQAVAVHDHHAASPLRRADNAPDTGHRGACA